MAACCTLFMTPALIPPAWAGPPLKGPVAASVERVIDGDTVKMRAQIWIDQELVISVRVAGIDAPELFRPKCAAEKARAREAKLFVEDFLSSGEAILRDVAYGKYAGRVVARIEAAGADLGEALVAEGLAVNGARGNWCAGA
jgi:endonuclease YncB( thermonuclease family)